MLDSPMRLTVLERYENDSTNKTGETRAAVRHRGYPTWLVISFVVTTAITVLAAVLVVISPFFLNASQAICLAFVTAGGLLVLSFVIGKASRIRERSR